MCNKTSRNLYYSLAAVIMISSSFFTHAETTQTKGCKDRNVIENTLNENTADSKQESLGSNAIDSSQESTTNLARTQPNELMQGVVDWSLWISEDVDRKTLIISALQKALAVAFILTIVSLVARRKRKPARIDDTRILKAICID